MSSEPGDFGQDPAGGPAHASRLIEREACIPVPPVAAGSLLEVHVVLASAATGSSAAGTWGWDDGSHSAALIAELDEGRRASGSHTYRLPGLYAPVLTVSGRDGWPRSGTLRYLVAFDPARRALAACGSVVPTEREAEEGELLLPVGPTARPVFGLLLEPAPDSEGRWRLDFRYDDGELKFDAREIEWVAAPGAAQWSHLRGAGRISGKPGRYPFRLDLWQGEGGSTASLGRLVLRVYSVAADLNRDGPAYKMTGEICEGGVRVVQPHE